jgi:heme A synthase
MITTILWIVAVLLAIWVIYDVLENNKRLSTGTKVIWIVCAVLFNIVTAIVYYFVYKMK